LLKSPIASVQWHGGRGEEIVDLARTNLWRQREWVA
jgi:hypothetical protein